MEKKKRNMPAINAISAPSRIKSSVEDIHAWVDAQMKLNDAKIKNSQVLKNPLRTLSTQLEQIAKCFAEDSLKHAESMVEEILKEGSGYLFPDVQKRILDGTAGVWSFAKPLEFYSDKLKLADQRADTIFEMLENGNITDNDMLPPINLFTLIAVAVRSEERALPKRTAFSSSYDPKLLDTLRMKNTKRTVIAPNNKLSGWHGQAVTSRVVIYALNRNALRSVCHFQLRAKRCVIPQTPPSLCRA